MVIVKLFMMILIKRTVPLLTGQYLQQERISRKNVPQTQMLLTKRSRS